MKIGTEGALLELFLFRVFVGVLHCFVQHVDQAVLQTVFEVFCSAFLVHFLLLFLALSSAGRHRESQC